MTKEKQIDSFSKVILVGDVDTGKTSLVARLTSNSATAVSEKTNIVNVKMHHLEVKGSVFKTCIWDIVGEQQYHSMAVSASRDASGVFLVYDVSNLTTFKNCAGWLREIRHSRDSKLKVVLIGNKNDLQTKRAVTTEDAQAFATENDLLFLETSALNGYHVELAFEQMATALSNSNNNIQQNTFKVVLVDIKEATKNKIHCVQKELQGDLKFIALSYRWGELQETTVDTKLGYVAVIKSFRLQDFYNLCRAIGRDPDLKQMDYVWVDAICVNQTNYDQRKATIYHMSDIYNHANHILAVPDLHLQHMKNTSTLTARMMADYYFEAEYLYHLLHGNVDQLSELDQKFLDLLYVPQDHSARQWLTRYTDFFAAGFMKNRDHDLEYQPRKSLDHLCETIKATYCSATEEMTDYDKPISIMKQEYWKEAIAEDESFLEMEDRVHFCNEEYCPLDYFEELGPPWRSSYASGYMDDAHRWYDKIVERNTTIMHSMHLLMDAVKDWSTRAWVISECNIARKKKSLRYWFVQFSPLLGTDDSPQDPSQLVFYHFGFDKSAADIVDDHPRWRLNENVEPTYNQFHNLMIKQLNDQTFLEMILKSKASRNEDRFYAVLPNSQYNDKLENRDVVSSWNIESTVSVKLKLYEWMTVKEKLDLFFLSGHFESVDFYLASPTFATSNIDWGSLYVPYPPMDAFSTHWNFDLDNNDTIQLHPPSSDHHHSGTYHLNVKPKTYYLPTAEHKKSYVDKYFIDYVAIAQRFQSRNYSDIDFIYIPPFDMRYVTSEFNYMYWYLSGVFLVGCKATNRWELYKYQECFTYYILDTWQRCDGDDFSAGFNIY